MIYNLDYKSANEVILKSSPAAIANVRGSLKFPNISGMVSLYQTANGAIVVADIKNLPKTETNIFAFHIHEGSTCTGNNADPFANAMGHFNPTNMPHPMHAGDLPPLFSNNGTAWSAVLTNRFQVKDVIGKVVIIHDNPDDFKTQPAGDSGTKIACGVIIRAH